MFISSRIASGLLGVTVDTRYAGYIARGAEAQVRKQSRENNDYENVMSFGEPILQKEPRHNHASMNESVNYAVTRN